VNARFGKPRWGFEKRHELVPICSVFRNIFWLLLLWGMACFLSACSGMVGGGGVMLAGPLPQGQSTAASLSVGQTNCLDGDCHASLISEKKQSVHSPFERGECLSCHSGDHQGTFLSPKQTLTLCYSCHAPDSLGYSHPVGTGVTDPRSGEMLTCLSCHEQHSAVYAHLLPLDGRGQLCVTCHTEFLQ